MPEKVNRCRQINTGNHLLLPLLWVHTVRTYLEDPDIVTDGMLKPEMKKCLDRELAGIKRPIALRIQVIYKPCSNQNHNLHTMGGTVALFINMVIIFPETAST